MARVFESPNGDFDRLGPEAKVDRLIGNRREVTGIAIDSGKTRTREDLVSAESRADGLRLAVSVPDIPLLQEHRIRPIYGKFVKGKRKPTITFSAVLDSEERLFRFALERTYVGDFVALTPAEFVDVLCQSETTEPASGLGPLKTASDLLHRRYGAFPQPVASERTVELFMRFAREVAQRYEELVTQMPGGQPEQNYRGITAPLRFKEGRDALRRLVHVAEHAHEFA